MKITVFTSNQPRHISLIESLANIADQVFAVQECNTVFPGYVKDFFDNSLIMQKYFNKVMKAEKKVFGTPRFTPSNIHHLILKLGDLNRLTIESLKPALNSDAYIVFGGSYIKGTLCDFLVKHKAFNIHMGVSPYYRGSSCNFWALYDKKVEFVGATIHMLTKGLDSGPMLFHALPKVQKVDPFLLGMQAVKSAHLGLIDYIKSGKIWRIKPIQQNKKSEIRYTKNRDFTDEIVSEYFNNLISPFNIYTAIKKRNMKLFLHPYII